MYWIAIKMLVGERGRYISMIVGVFFASMIINQQSSIFCGLMSRTFGFLTDTRINDLWVVDPKVQYIDDVKPLLDTKLLSVRSISGVEWAMPLYKGNIRARLSNGTFQSCNVIGVDDATLIGGPVKLVEGTLADLRQSDAVIVDEVAAKTKLAIPLNDGTDAKRPLVRGDILELNDRRAVVVGFASITRTFQSQPVIYTTYSRATTFAPRERKLLSFILVKAKAGQNLEELKQRIESSSGLKSYTNDEFSNMTLNYFMKATGIPINFGIAILLAIIIGTAIVGQTFYSFTTDNLKYFATLRAMGARKKQLLLMIFLQAAISGITGYGLGLGVASLFYRVSLKSELAFRMIWQIPVFSSLAVIFVCLFAAVLSIWKVLRLEPAIVFK